MPLQGEAKELATIVLRNRSRRPIILKRARSGIEIPIAEFGVMGVKLYESKEHPFLSFDMEAGIVWIDFGEQTDPTT